jgi:hypothetical protein
MGVVVKKPEKCFRAFICLLKAIIRISTIIIQQQELQLLQQQLLQQQL